MWSHESDSNRRPAVYETAALPTELSWLSESSASRRGEHKLNLAHHRRRPESSRRAVESARAEDLRDASGRSLCLTSATILGLIAAEVPAARTIPSPLISLPTGHQADRRPLTADRPQPGLGTQKLTVMPLHDPGPRACPRRARSASRRRRISPGPARGVTET